MATLAGEHPARMNAEVFPHLALALALGFAHSAAAAEERADVIVYGGTPAGAN